MAHQALVQESIKIAQKIGPEKFDPEYNLQSLSLTMSGDEWRAWWRALNAPEPAPEPQQSAKSTAKK